MSVKTQLLKLFGIICHKPPIILCIGSDRVTGDCFGPLVGEQLVNFHNVNAFVYGTLAKPVTAINLLAHVAFIKLKHHNCPIFAIDSSLGNRQDVGTFRLIADGIYPGAATGKKMPKVGDFSLTATVAPLGTGLNLYGVKLGFVHNLANIAANEIAGALNCFNKESMAV